MIPGSFSCKYDSILEDVDSRIEGFGLLSAFSYIAPHSCCGASMISDDSQSHRAAYDHRIKNRNTVQRLQDYTLAWQRDSVSEIINI